MARLFLIDPRIVDWETDSADRALLIAETAGLLNVNH